MSSKTEVSSPGSPDMVTGFSGVNAEESSGSGARNTSPLLIPVCAHCQGQSWGRGRGRGEKGVDGKWGKGGEGGKRKGEKRGAERKKREKGGKGGKKRGKEKGRKRGEMTKKGETKEKYI